MPDKRNCSSCEHAIPNIEKRNMHFERKISYSGKSLIISIPEDLIKYMGVSKGDRVKIIPVNKGAFLVEVL